jgi:hypothetical protein
MKKTILLGIMVVVSFLSCKKEEEGPSIMVNNAGALATDTIARGTFTGYAHSLSGNAILYTDINNATVLQLENFNMTSGPDVHVLLSKTASYSASNVLDLGQLSATTGYTNSKLSYTVSDYNAAYKYVLIHCITFSSLFGSTQLINE